MCVFCFPCFSSYLFCVFLKRFFDFYVTRRFFRGFPFSSTIICFNRLTVASLLWTAYQNRTLSRFLAMITKKKTIYMYKQLKSFTGIELRNVYWIFVSLLVSSICYIRLKLVCFIYLVSTMWLCCVCFLSVVLLNPQSVTALLANPVNAGTVSQANVC